MQRPQEKDLERFCTMLGLMTLTWAWAENTLAMTLGVIEENEAAARNYGDAPLSLKRRIKRLRTMVKDLPTLHPFKDEGNALAERFKSLGARRHAFVHGSTWLLEQGSFQAVGIAVRNGKYAVNEHHFNISDAVSLNGEIAKLVDDATSFLFRINVFFQK